MVPQKFSQEGEWTFQISWGGTNFLVGGEWEFEITWAGIFFGSENENSEFCLGVNQP